MNENKSAKNWKKLELWRESSLKKFENNNREIKSQSSMETDRTLFVGNVGISTKKKNLLKIFSKYGKIESVRLRGVTPADPKMSKRLAAIKRLFHPKRSTVYYYIVFENKEDAFKAVQINGTKLDDHIVRVQLCNDNTELEPTKAIFIGNLPFDSEEDELWTVFEQYGKIVSVRIVRNSETGMCIGIGFVNFESPDAVELVLMTGSVKIKNRELRIQRYSKPRIKKSKVACKLKTKVATKKIETFKNARSSRGSHKRNVCRSSKLSRHLNVKTKKNKGLNLNKRMIKEIAPR